MTRRSLIILLVAMLVSVVCYERADKNPYGRWFAEVMENVDRQYVATVEPEALFADALDGMLGKLDDYSSYVGREEASEFRQMLQQQYGGIGIEVSQDGADKPLTVSNPLVDTPAYKMGVLAGDEIVAIDGHPAKAMNLKEIVHALRGQPDTEVTLTVHRAGHEEPIEFHLVRAVIKSQSVLGDTRDTSGVWNFMLPGDERVGYVRITTFGAVTLEELKAALAALQAKRCRGLILDLRGNPGGGLDTAERVCDLFLPKNAVIVTTRSRGLADDVCKADGKGPYQKLPMVVLVNENSASASEIVAACLQYHDRATIVGQRTWGKGTVQNVIPVEGGRSLLKLTVATYWPPSEKNIHRTKDSKETDVWGVMPDEGCEVKMEDAARKTMDQKRRQRDVLPMPGNAPPDDVAASPADFDPQLERALEVLSEKLSKSK